MKYIPLALLIFGANAFACPAFEGSNYQCEDADDTQAMASLSLRGNRLEAGGQGIVLNGTPQPFVGGITSGTCAGNKVVLTESKHNLQATSEIVVGPADITMAGEMIIDSCDVDANQNCIRGTERARIEKVRIACRKK